MKPGNIELHIEELILYGFAPGDGHRIGAAVEAELARLFAEQGAPPSLVRGGTVPHLDGGTFEAAPGSSPEVIGTQMAQSLYGGLSQ